MFRLALHWQILLGVVSAAVIGLTLNATVSEKKTDDIAVTDGKHKGKKLQVHDTVNKTTITLTDEEKGTTETWVVDPLNKTKLPPEQTKPTKDTYTIERVPDKKPETFILKKLPTKPRDTTKVYYTFDRLQDNDPQIYVLFQKHGRSWARWIGDIGNLIGALFLRMLRMVSVPLIIASLLTGVLSLRDARRLRKLFGMTVLYYISTSALAIFVGISLVNLVQPGAAFRQVAGEEAAANNEQPQGDESLASQDLTETLYEQMNRMIPTNPVGAVANGEFLSIIAFTLAFGIFTLLVGGKTYETMKSLAETAFAIMMKMTMAIIYLAPVGVFALMLYATATQGTEVFASLGWYLLTVALALVVHAMVVLPIIVSVVARRNPFEYAHAMSPALMTAFSSASSNATLPLTMSCVEERAGISNRVGSFVLPLGATVNMDGTALFEVIAVLFIAQLEPTVSLTLTQQIIVAFTALLASIGAAGIPSAGLVMMVIVLQAVGLPIDKVGLILAVDRILDMCRTSVNVWSDSCGCAVVARFEGQPTETDDGENLSGNPAGIIEFAPQPSSSDHITAEKSES